MDLLERSAPLPTARSHGGLELVALHGGLTRVLHRDGGVIGYVETFEEPAGTRYRAKRMRPRAVGFSIVGEFWSADEALDALRFG
jgi:predicted methyltransferase